MGTYRGMEKKMEATILGVLEGLRLGGSTQRVHVSI